MLIFEIQGIGWNFSMTRMSYKFTKSTTQTEKFEKILDLYDIINLVTFRHKLTASGNIILSALNYKLMRPVIILRLHKE